MMLGMPLSVSAVMRISRTITLFRLAYSAR